MNEERKEITIHTDYIVLGALLKFSGLTQSGSESKEVLLTKSVYVNEERETRRGRKIYPGDVVRIENISLLIKK